MKKNILQFIFILSLGVFAIPSFSFASEVYPVSGSQDDTLRKIDPSGNEVWKFDGHSATVRGVVVDNDGYVYSGSIDNTVRKIDPSGNEVWVFNGHDSFVRGVAVDNNGYVYSGSFDDTVRKIDPSGDQVWKFEEHDGSVETVAVPFEEGEVYEIPDGTIIDFEGLESHGDDAGVEMHHNYFYEDDENDRVGFNYSFHRIRAADEQGDYYVPWIDDTLEFTERMLVFEDPTGEDLVEYFHSGSHVYEWSRRFPLTNYFNVLNQTFTISVSSLKLNSSILSIILPTCISIAVTAAKYPFKSSLGLLPCLSP